MRAKDISIAGVINKVSNAAKNTNIELVSLTEVKMNKTGKDENGNKIPNPYFGCIQKRSHVVGEIKYNYMDLVNRQRINEGKEATFVPSERVWGDSDGALVSKPDGAIYLNVRVIKSNKTDYFYNGNPIEKSKIEAFLPSSNSSSSKEKQGVKEEIIVRTYKLASIQQIKLGATMYTVK